MTHRNRNYILPLYMLGFFCGIVYANLIGTKYITTNGIFHEYFIEQYTQQDIRTLEYFLYLSWQRLLPIIFLVFAGMTKLKKITAVGCLVWTGFSGGVLAVGAVIRMGMKGMLYYLAILFPHMLFYIFAYVILINYYLKSDKILWNKWKMGVVVLMMSVGILMETFVNPYILKWIIKIIG